MHTTPEDSLVTTNAAQEQQCAITLGRCGRSKTSVSQGIKPVSGRTKGVSKNSVAPTSQNRGRSKVNNSPKAQKAQSPLQKQQAENLQQLGNISLDEFKNIFGDSNALLLKMLPPPVFAAWASQTIIKDYYPDSTYSLAEICATPLWKSAPFFDKSVQNYFSNLSPALLQDIAAGSKPDIPAMAKEITASMANSKELAAGLTEKSMRMIIRNQLQKALHNNPEVNEKMKDSGRLGRRYSEELFANAGSLTEKLTQELGKSLLPKMADEPAKIDNSLHHEYLLHTKAAKQAKSLVAAIDLATAEDSAELSHNLKSIISKRQEGYNKDVVFFSQFRDCTIDDLAFLFKHALAERADYQQKSTKEKEKLDKVPQEFAQEIATAASMTICRHTGDAVLQRAISEIERLEAAPKPLSAEDESLLKKCKSIRFNIGTGYQERTTNYNKVINPEFLQNNSNTFQEQAKKFGFSLAGEANILTEGMVLHKEFKDNLNTVWAFMSSMAVSSLASAAGIAVLDPALKAISGMLKVNDELLTASTNELTFEQNAEKFTDLALNAIVNEIIDQKTGNLLEKGVNPTIGSPDTFKKLSDQDFEQFKVAVGLLTTIPTDKAKEATTAPLIKELASQVVDIVSYLKGKATKEGAK